MLGATVGKSNRVRSNGISISLAGLSSVEGSLGVIISYGVFKCVGFGRTIISWFGVVGRGRFVVCRSVDNWGMDNWGMVCRSMDNWGMVSRSVDNWGMVCRSMNNWGVVRSWGGMVSNSMMGNTMMGNTMMSKTMMTNTVMTNAMMNSVVTSYVGWGVGSGDGSRSNHSSRVFFGVVISMDSLWGSVGLTSHSSGIGTMGLVNGVAH